MIILIDNYDSFVHNLARYCRLLGQSTLVFRNDEVSLEAIEALQPAAIILSPGPCTPDQAGVSSQVVERCGPRVPILGICLGHQTIVQTYGGRIDQSDRPMHGMACDIHHDRRGEFANLDVPFTAGRYHSLHAAAPSLPACLEVSAWTADGMIMGVRHRQYRVSGWQFHPESILTPAGLDLLRNFLHLAGIASEGTRQFAEEFPAQPSRKPASSTVPITF